MNSSKSLFWPEVINLAEIDLDIIGIGGSTANRDESDNDCFCRHQRSFAQQRSPEQTKRASDGRACCVASNQRRSGVHWQDEGRVERRRSPEDNSEASICAIPRICAPPGWIEFCICNNYAPLRRELDVIIPAPNREVEATILKLLRSELPAKWSDISNAVKRLKDHLLQMLRLDKVLGMELSKFSRQLKMKPRIDDDYQVVVEMPNDLRLRGMKVEKKERSRTPKKQNLTWKLCFCK